MTQSALALQLWAHIISSPLSPKGLHQKELIKNLCKDIEFDVSLTCYDKATDSFSYNIPEGVDSSRAYREAKKVCKQRLMNNGCKVFVEMDSVKNKLIVSVTQ